MLTTSTGAQVRKFTASDGAANDYFGGNVAFNPDGSQVLISAAGDDSGRGSVYILNASTGAQIQKLTASDAAANDAFGSGVGFSSDGSKIVVGAPQYSVGNGKAYILESDGASCSGGGGGGEACSSLGSCSVEGRMEYDSTNKVMMYCDGVDWYPLAAATP